MRVLLAVAAILAIAVAQVSALSDIPFTRAIYKPPDFSLDGAWNFSELRSLGIDAFYSYGDYLWEATSPGWAENTFGTESLSARECNVTFVAGQYYESGQVDFGFTRAVNRYGEEEPRTASPTDRTYWREVVEKGAVFMANLSTRYPIWGVVWDIELYLSTSRWPLGSYSFDAPALERFGLDTNRTIPSLQPKDRYNYLKRNGMLDEYQAWQAGVVEGFARDTARKVEEMNPNLSLGILGIQDEWFDWAILRGFNASSAPITAWSGLTYPGYDEDLVDHFKDVWRQNDLHGAFIPGFYTVQISPFDLMVNMESAIRRDGVLWIYQRDGDPYRLAGPAEYRTAYDLFQRHIFFDGYEAEPLPVFDVYPGGEARPYRGNGSVSVMLPYDLMFHLEGDLIFASERDEIGVVDNDLAGGTLRDGMLESNRLPCIVTGLAEEDLTVTHARSMIRELEDLLSACREVGLDLLEESAAELDAARTLYQAGEFEGSREKLVGIRADWYGRLMSRLWELYEEAVQSPRNSTMPLASLKSVAAAHDGFLGEDLARARSHLFRGLDQWRMAVVEGILPLLMIFPLILSTARNRAGDRLADPR